MIFKLLGGMGFLCGTFVCDCLLVFANIFAITMWTSATSPINFTETKFCPWISLDIHTLGELLLVN